MIAADHLWSGTAPRFSDFSIMMQHNDLTGSPYREPLRVTLARTVTIALAAGAVLAARLGGLRYWPIATLLILWPSFGGHWVELFYLNSLRPRLPSARVVQTAVRVGVWFIGGVFLVLGMRMTAILAGFEPARWPGWGSTWWIGGLAFVVIEMAVHLVLQLRGRPSLYNGRR